LGQPVRQASALACKGSVCHPKREWEKETRGEERRRDERKGEQEEEYIRKNIFKAHSISDQSETRRFSRWSTLVKCGGVFSQ